jgi:hypothetical protein
MAKDKVNGKDEEEELLEMVGDGADEDNNESAESAKSSAKSKQSGNGEARADEDDDDETTGGGEPGEELEARTEDRRNERKTRKQRQREARERDQRELNFLRSRNENLERRLSGVEQRVVSTEVSAIDARINQLNQQIAVADQVIAEGIKNQMGDEVVEAQAIRDKLVSNRAILSQQKTTRSNSRQQAAAPTIDPEHIRLGRQFMKKHSWYDVTGQDEDSAIMNTIDARVLADGFDPRTEEYYEELEKRAKKRLPEKFRKFNGHGQDDDEDDDQTDDGQEEEVESKPRKRTSGGPRMRSGGREAPLKPNQVQVSAERKEAMVEQGVWDDPVLRNRYLKQYAKWDRENAELLNRGKH